MSEILEFIKVFQSSHTLVLFKDTACYWFALILHERFEGSIIVYEPHLIHFATKIKGNVYDISGLVDNPEDYIIWETYNPPLKDKLLIEEYCIKLRGGD